MRRFFSLVLRIVHSHAPLHRHLVYRRAMRTFTLACVFTLLACEEPAPPPFPDGFLFGAATAGFQIDPGCPTLPEAECVDSRSDWYQWVTSPGELSDLADIITFEPLSNGPGYWELYDADLERAKKELGLNAVRVSIEWSRVFPEATDGLEGEALAAVANQAALAGYHAQFAAMKSRGLTPLVTLNHYTMPVWIHDGVACHQSLTSPACEAAKGWLDRERAVREIAKYAGFVAKEFANEVELWATENEPFAVVLPGFLQPSKDRANPPGLLLKLAEGREVMNSLIYAHAAMYDAVKANDPTSKVGLVYAVVPFKGKDPGKRLDTIAAENTFYLYNTAFLDAVVLGKLDEDLDGEPDAAEPVAELRGRMDWLGINYYTRTTVEGIESPAFPQLSPISNFNPLTIEVWEDYPKGIYDVLMFAQQRYGIPTYIAETGTDAAGDSSRVERWLTVELEWTKRAIADGADVRGFFYWSLMDNYEWNHGMDMRFGLFEVAGDAPKTRTARSGVATYKKIIEAGDVPEDLLKQFPPE